jgi:hypothetical protein
LKAEEDHDEKRTFPQCSLAVLLAIFAISVAQVEKRNPHLSDFSSLYLYHWYGRLAVFQKLAYQAFVLLLMMKDVCDVHH